MSKATRSFLKIEGDVFNVSDSERASPTIRLAVRDETGRELFHWTVLADPARIKPGDYAPSALASRSRRKTCTASRLQRLTAIE
jgi:hypothetical protein